MPVEAPTRRSHATLDEVRTIVGAFCAHTDPALLSGADAAVAVEGLATVIRQLTAKQAQFAARVDECHSHSRRFASSDDFLARVNGSSRGDAKRAIDTARRLRLAPGAASAAFDQGRLSVGEADAISAAAALDPSAEGRLVERAASNHDLADVRERADKVKAAARHGEDPAVRRARLRALRRWREFDRDGMREVMGRFVPEEWARVAPVIDAYLEAQFQQARRDGRREPIEAYRADAVLAALAAAGEAVGLNPTGTPTTTTTPAKGDATVESGAAESGAAESGAAESGASESAADPTELDGTGAEADLNGAAELGAILKVRPDRVRWNLCLMVDAIALQRGYPTATETCEIVGFGPVSIDLAREILPDALVDVLVHDLVDIKAHATMTRHQKRALKAALKVRDRRCVVPGCKRRRRLQADHRHDYAEQGPTAYQNMELLCDVHHDEKTHRGARIERTTTEWCWFPPPPTPGQPEPPPGSIPWRAPVGEHLTGFDLTDLPPPDRPDLPYELDDADELGGTLPFA